MTSVVKGIPFNSKITDCEANLRRYVKPRKDSREFSPVQIRPDDIAADIQKLKKNEHERSEQMKEFTEETRYATRLLLQARSYNIRYLPKEISVKTLDKFISNPKKLNEFISDLENLIHDYQNPYHKIKNEAEKIIDDLEDPNIEIAQKLLGKAKFIRVKGLPDEVPRDEDLSRFIKELLKTILKHNEKKAEQAHTLMLELKAEREATENGNSNVLKSNCMKIAIPLITIVGAFLLLIK